VNEKNAIISGMSQSIMAWLPAWRGSVDGCMVIFCWIQVETKTSTGMTRLVGSAWARSNQRKFEFKGAAAWIGAKGIQPYNFSDSPTRSSGFAKTV